MQQPDLTDDSKNLPEHDAATDAEVASLEAHADAPYPTFSDGLDDQPVPEDMFPDLDKPEKPRPAGMVDEADAMVYENVKPPTHLHRIISLLRVGPIAIILRLVDQALRILTGAPVWKLSRVTEHVYLGGQHYKRGWKAMEKEGIKAVLNMREEKFDDPGQGIGGEFHKHLPTIDNTPPTLENLEEAALFIDEQVEAGNKVYIHCGVGVGRAPSATAAYFIYAGLSADEAVRKIKKVRPFVHLTGRQRKQLHVLEDYIRERYGTGDVL